MTRRQHHRGKKRPKSWHRGKTEARGWAKARELPYVGSDADPTTGAPTPLPNRNHPRRNGHGDSI